MIKPVYKSINSAFTLVEMLVAMAITLLMMAALARSFGFVGEKVRDSRADVEMSGRLVDINARLSNEIGNCTVSLTPTMNGKEPEGYATFTEGPLTDATSSLFRVFDGTDNQLVLDESRYGDFDDYLAFTAVAEGNNWFTGKVPRFILDQRQIDLLPQNNDTNPSNDVAYNPASFPGNALDPVVIRSKYAEIVYFASPEYTSTSTPDNLQIVDVDNNGYPDRINLHRRVLLIRPDLNLTSNSLARATGYGTAPAVDGRFILQNNTLRTGSFVPGDHWLIADQWPVGSTFTSRFNTARQAWLYGMAGVHQQCDLSLRRLYDSTGNPTTQVAANSLADLAQPENRFAHVRVPNPVLLGAATGSSTIDNNFPTSMPVVAQTPPLAVLGANSTTPVQLPPPLVPNTSAVVTPNMLSGFIRPEFILGQDREHLEYAGDAWASERLGEDVLANNVLAFDVQIFDPQAFQFTTSNNLVVGPNDAGFREALVEKINEVNNGVFREFSQGGFVDLAYPVLAGGTLRGWQPRLLDLRGTNSSGISTLNSYLHTDFSGVRVVITQTVTGQVRNYAMTNELFRSGRLVAIGGQIRLFQPAFDTFTNHFESDGFYQNYNTGSNGVGTQWSKQQQGALVATTIVDAGADGLDNDGLHGADDVAERETLPPFLNPAEAIKITVRIENPSTRQMRQASVVHRD